MTRGLLDSRLGQRLGRIYDDACTIEALGSGRSATGAPNGSWAAVSGLTALPCRLTRAAPPGELEQLDQTITVSTHRIAFRERYSTITTKHRAVIGSQTFDIVRVDADSAENSTYLDVELVV